MGEGISYEEYLDAHGSLTYSNVGTSMLPLLREGKDLFTVKKKGPERCRVGDVVLYRRPPAHYVLHRVVEVHADDYVILGDNCVARETGVTDDDIIGVMCGFVRDGKEHTVDEFGYRLYSAFWMVLAPIRITCKKVRLRLGRLVR